ncbi:aldo/keto reductase [Fructobacillus tropaeoli]|uniref:2,5-didehydrogluconate reductase n=1 Tax=Fructobacillus tropaeoli TaxID=709323 RepID=A0A3F3H5U0_9LACO|nr:aldo/keto reductase [Fructobacillus tropaeoli]GAP04977.1 2,5-didehydrogluconate reductase [Fructobacillus tropaeoli]
MEYTILNNGVQMPKLGFGVYQIPVDETKEAVLNAIKIGYRLIDTAGAYKNEVQVGQAVNEAIKAGIVKREELFITTKLWVSEYNEQHAEKAINDRLQKMQLDYLDLLLLHQPYGDIYGAWRAMEKSLNAGKLRSIGVSNFDSGKIVEFAKLVSVTPQVNQLEFNPWNQRENDEEWNRKYHVQPEAWAPFAEGRLDLFHNEILQEIGNKYNKTIGQVVLRWLVQRNIVVLAKSVRESRMRENMDIFDFSLSESDMNLIKSLNRNETAFFDHHDPIQVERITGWTL